MVNYYINAVHQVNGIIERVKICTSYTSTGPNNETEKTRKYVIDNIDKDNKTIYTIYKNNSGEYQLGALVITEEIENKKYIKTKANGKKCDNLDEIEQY